jgi:CubicO group peptidase (beta-lactamase class C family)
LLPFTLSGIGSTTKALTASVLGSLVDEGRLSWSTLFSDIFPEGSSSRPNFDATLEDALTHRLGLRKNNKLWFFNISGDPASVTRTWANYFPSVLPLRYQWDYHNFGFALAGAVASRVTQKDLYSLYRERIFFPLNLTSGVYATAREALAQPALYAFPYARNSAGNIVPLPRDANTVIDGAVAGAGSVQMSIRAVTKYLNATQNGLSPVLSPSSFTRITSPRHSTFPNDGYVSYLNFWFHAYGYGWVVGNYRGFKFIWHAGGTIGHTTCFMTFPELKISVGVLTNQFKIDPFGHILFALYAFDQLQGFPSLITPDNICSVAFTAPVAGPELWGALNTTLADPSPYPGLYCHCLWRTANVTKVGSNSLSLTLGAAKGLLYPQQGTTFKWFGEEWVDPEEMTVRFDSNGLYINLNKEEATPQPDVYFQRGNNCNCN